MQPAEAQISFEEVIEMPEATPPEPVKVIEVQVTFDGLSPLQAERDDFQDSFEQAVAQQLGVDEGSVEVTGVFVDDEGDVVLVYVIKDIPPEDLEATQQALETQDMAQAIGDQLEEGEYMFS